MTILGCIIGALIDVAGATIGGIIADRIGIDCRIGFVTGAILTVVVLIIVL